jgi:hypothetical protein
MKTQIENNKKRTYKMPNIERIKIDAEISLALESTPPEGPDETSQAPECFNNDPFKTNLG